MLSAETQSEKQFKIISNNPRRSKFFFNQSTRIANFCPTISFLARRRGQSANFHDEEIWGQISVFKLSDREKETYNLFQPIKTLSTVSLLLTNRCFSGNLSTRRWQMEAKKVNTAIDYKLFCKKTTYTKRLFRHWKVLVMIIGSSLQQGAYHDHDSNKNPTNLHIWQWKTLFLHALHVHFSSFDILKTFSFFLRRDMTCFAVVWTTRAYDDKCSILSSKAILTVTLPIVINVPTRGLLAVETKNSFVLWLSNLNIKRIVYKQWISLMSQALVPI